ncbi:hypothetical protein R3P93_22520 [Rhodococcus cerastii]|uniref:Uncharacterized protein n=1 Tax=Rhodococcus cerastii TaxID=908616 RepID=A0ABU4D6J1_9NOCA|nr:hypothetical protein [Rhodococcus cerastii]MDV6305349.1 hypothetical protein [Rhodococcus cerastii]
MTDTHASALQPPIDGLDTAPLTPGEIADLIDSLSAGGAGWSPEDTGPVWWLHAELGYGYLVGRHIAGGWTLAGPDGRAVNALDPSWIQIRVFRPGRELILYRDRDHIAGTSRVLTDTASAAGQPNTRTLRIERTAAALRTPAVFPVVRDPATGLTAVIPEPRRGTMPVALVVREHFSRDQDTGAIRVAAVCWDRYRGGASDALIDGELQPSDRPLS